MSLAVVVAEQPSPAQTDNSQVQQSRALAVKSKPQIVYNVRSRETAEALHAQSKPAGDVSLPIDANMPISLQLSRSNANAEAAAARAAEMTPAPSIAPRVTKRKTQSVPRMMIPPNQAKQFGPARNAGHGRGKNKRD